MHLLTVIQQCTDAKNHCYLLERLTSSTLPLSLNRSTMLQIGFLFVFWNSRWKHEYVQQRNQLQKAKCKLEKNDTASNVNTHRTHVCFGCIGKMHIFIQKFTTHMVRWIYNATPNYRLLNKYHWCRVGVII